VSAVARLAEVLSEEARRAESQGDGQAADRLLRLACTAGDMTPAELTWAAEASEEQMREFARALRDGCGQSGVADLAAATGTP
jgi:hypothetical protein